MSIRGFQVRNKFTGLYANTKKLALAMDNVRLKQENDARVASHRAVIHSILRILRLWCVFLATSVFTGTIPGYAQSLSADSAATDSMQGRVRLGPRFALGGTFSLYSTSAELLRDSYPMYGARTRALIPVGSQIDLTATGEFLRIPKKRSPVYRGMVNDRWSITRVQMTEMACLHFGMRLYWRKKKMPPPVTLLSSRYEHMFWRGRVDRTGFHLGISSGIVLGWHHSAVRTEPSDWPLYMSVLPQSAVEFSEYTYTRFYWSIPTPEFGWTFSGRCDFTFGLGKIVPLYKDDPYKPDLSIEMGELMMTGNICAVFGERGERVRRLIKSNSDTISEDHPAHDIAKLYPRFDFGGISAMNVNYTPILGPIHGAGVGAGIPFGAHMDVVAQGAYLVTPRRDYYSAYQGMITDKPSPLAVVVVGVRYYGRVREVRAFNNARTRRMERSVWRQRVDRSGGHLGIVTGVMHNWHQRVIQTQSFEQNHWYWISPSIELGWTFKGLVDFSIEGGNAIKLHSEQPYVGGWLLGARLAVIYSRPSRVAL